MNPEPSISAKWLELLKEIAPATSRVMVVLNADNVANLSRLRVIEASAPLFGVRRSPQARYAMPAKSKARSAPLDAR